MFVDQNVINKAAESISGHLHIHMKYQSCSSQMSVQAFACQAGVLSNVRS